ncbi:recombinase family protein [Streptomyces sp. NPDC058252]|uniref:recombinase family protein n=1 Tax=Streptomyces sp. NPDC058252 TaxID=3346405 RepID=UPI0036EBB355
MAIRADDRPLGGYLRISDVDVAELRRAVKAGKITKEEAAEEEKKAIIKQKEDLRFLAERHNRSVVWYEDHRLSAFKRNVKRTDFLRMLADLKAERIVGVLAYDIDRFARQPRDLEKYIDVYEDFSEKNKKPVFDTLSGQNFDLTTSDGRFSARLYVSIANKSSEDTSRRIKRDNKYRAEKGRYHGGNIPYGWLEADRDKKDPVAAAIVNTAMDMYIAGDKNTTITQYFVDQKVVNPATDKPYTWAGVKSIILRERNAGIRIYLGEVMYDADGEYIKGPWEPLCSVEKYEAVQGAKAEREKTQSRSYIVHDHKTQVKYLLSRIARCGRCGYPMVGKPVWVRGKKTGSFAYNCNKTSTSPEACGKLGVTGPPVDELIKKLIWQIVEKSSQQKKIPEKHHSDWTPEKEARLAVVEQELKDIKALWDAKKVGAVIYMTTFDQLEAERKDLRALRAFSAPAAVRAVTPELLRAGWEGMSVERQRVVIRSVLTAVVVYPARDGKKGGPFDRKRIEPVFAA